MAKTIKKRKRLSKLRQAINLIREWKEVIAIIGSVGAIIYYASTYKAEIDSGLKSKVNESEVRTLIQIENQDLKDDVKAIKNILMSREE